MRKCDLKAKFKASCKSWSVWFGAAGLFLFDMVYESQAILPELRQYLTPVQYYTVYFIVMAILRVRKVKADNAT